MTLLAQPRPDESFKKIRSAFKSQVLDSGAQNVMTPLTIRMSPLGVPMANSESPRKRFSWVTKLEFLRSNALVRTLTEAESPIRRLPGRLILTPPSALPSPVEFKNEI